MYEFQNEKKETRKEKKAQSMFGKNVCFREDFVTGSRGYRGS